MPSLSYTTERQVVGLLKIAERMLSREPKVRGPILSLMGKLLVSPRTASFGTGAAAGSAAGAGAGHSPLPKRSPASADPSPQPLDDKLLAELSGQLAAGAWRVLTVNVSCLPSLGVEQWQVLFDLLALSAGSGGYASVKSFEVSWCWGCLGRLCLCLCLCLGLCL